MTEAGPWCADRVPRTTRSARADRPTSARPGWPWTTSWLTEGAFGVFPSFEGGYDPADAVDQAIMAARKAVFPLHGLMP